MKTHACCTLMLTLLAGGITPALAQPEPIPMAGVLPGGHVMVPRMVSMKDRPFEGLVRQEKDFSCGAASLATILKYGYDIPVDEETVLAGMLRHADEKVVMQKGFSLLDMKRYLRALGYRGRGYKVNLTKLLDLSVPTIVLLDMDGYNHFVVLKRVRKGEVFVADPALGHRRIPIETFMRQWHSRVVFAVVGPAFDRKTSLLQVEDEKGRPLDQFQVQASRDQMLDFGFTQAELF